MFHLIEKLNTDEEKALKIYQAGFLQAAFKTVEETSIQPSTTLELFKTLLSLAKSEDVNSFIGEAGAHAIVKQIEANLDNKEIAEAGTVNLNPLVALTS